MGEELFSIKSNLKWLEDIPRPIKTVYFGTLLNNGVINEAYCKYKTSFFKRKLKSRTHVGVWGWNSWNGIHTFPLLINGSYIDIFRKTLEVGFERTEEGTGILPHAIIHRDGIFGSEATYKCYGGKNGEGYNIDNILCWAKMAMEYFLITNDAKWLDEKKQAIITTSINYLLDNYRAKYNPSLIYTGIEGDWTECTEWELDNANVNLNMIRTLELLLESQKAQSAPFKQNSGRSRDYKEIRNDILTNFIKPLEEGGFWSPKLKHYIHGNDGSGALIHGDKYFESTVNYFALLWNIAPPEHQSQLWEYIEANKDAIEKPYPVLTNYLPRTGARRKAYGRTVTNGDIWMVLGAHATAARLQAGYIDRGSEMFDIIYQYEQEEGFLHNCIYQNGKVNDTWDPEVANYGAFYPPIILGLLGMKLRAEGIEFNIRSLTGLTSLDIKLFVYGNPISLSITWDGDTPAEISARQIINDNPDENTDVKITSPQFLVVRKEPSDYSLEIQNL